jgi:GT2 family glycosyltransferase
VPTLFSILIPVRNDLENLRTCLRALGSSDLSDCEVLICDDGSTQALDLNELQQMVAGVRLQRQAPKGPAAARNRLARGGKGRYLFFLDADVQVLPGTLPTARRIVAENPDLKAFFGSYDDSPARPGLVNNYKNLSHHHLHQQSRGKISSFWCGCGVIDREVFRRQGGLLESFTRPSVEDIELGLRLSSSGTEIWCFPELQVKHLKRWTFANWVQTDLFRRGIPWVQTMARSGRWQSQLNFTWSQRAATVSAAVLPFSLTLAAWSPEWLVVASVSLLLFLWLHWGLWQLLARRQGTLRAILMIPLHLVYSYICVLSVLIGVATGLPQRFRSPLDEASAGAYEEGAGETLTPPGLGA